jgi:hypothetical protein
MDLYGWVHGLNLLLNIGKNPFNVISRQHLNQKNKPIIQFIVYNKTSSAWD